MTVTVISERYGHKIPTFFPAIEKYNLVNLKFQHATQLERI